MSDNKSVYKVVIVDDHPLVIEGFKNVLKEDTSLRIVGQFGRVEDFEAFFSAAAVDLVLLDITLPDGNGIQLCGQIKSAYPDIIVLAISNLSERSIVKQMLQQGANGYLLKTADAHDILHCIAEAINGEIVLSQEVKELFDMADLRTKEDIPELTKREKQILSLLAEGKKSAEIADSLFISPLTVKTHRATLLQKFHTGNLVILINKAKEYGML
ncbi:response regulator [Sphingobacterium sp. DK4209]|uniref:Response regulator n=1 Tax=Sphingobacterium zhuxiongii TaxID=2662364 RepID=A0A5Q0QAF7_9SPHI|nr:MULTISPECIES: response regulator transcription factor [unclassified Sphingobacterium]MVZ65328.1 response regulator [Sphingobacterium sp. DK4209]QGA26416.1 response regulator [Sphingobacterium sp. dk4302]